MATSLHDVRFTPRADIRSRYVDVRFVPLVRRMHRTIYKQTWPDLAGPATITKLATTAFTGRRSNRTARHLQYCADHSGCSRRQALAKDATNSTTATPRRRATLYGQYDQPWPRPGCCSSSYDRCDPHPPETRDLLELSRLGRRDGSVRSPRQEQSGLARSTMCSCLACCCRCANRQRFERRPRP